MANCDNNQTPELRIIILGPDKVSLPKMETALPEEAFPLGDQNVSFWDVGGLHTHQEFMKYKRVRIFPEKNDDFAVECTQKYTEHDVKLVLDQIPKHITETEAREALEKCNGDIVDAIMSFDPLAQRDVLIMENAEHFITNECKGLDQIFSDSTVEEVD